MKDIFLQLEAKILEFERKLEAIKRSMIDIQSDKNMCEAPSRFGCEFCHNWQKKKINALQVKLDTTLQPKSAFAIDPSKYEISLNHSYKKHNFKKQDSNDKNIIHHNISCHYCCKNGHTSEKCKFRKMLFPKGVSQWLPKCNLDFTHFQGSN